MTTIPPRRFARSQDLPADEIALLRFYSQSGDTDALHVRCRELYLAGWPYRAMADAMIPKKNRTVVRSWIEKAPRQHPASYILTPIPLPELKTPEPGPGKPASPGISPTDRARIEELAPISRKFRASMAPEHPAALANQELTTLVLTLHESNVPVRELADAAGVTYRAMARRLDNGGRTR